MGLRQRFLLIFSFAFALFPNAVYAESHNSLSGVAETIERLFGFIPNIITLEKLLGEDAAAMFWARFLLWVLLFAAFYYGGSFAFKAGGKVNTRIAGTVAFVFASISALLIPEKIIVGVFQSYGLLSAILIWFVPVIAGFFLVSMIKPRPAKAVIYLGMIFVLVAIDDSITSNLASGLADTIWYAFFKLLLAIVIIAFLWNLLFAGVEGWNAATGGGHDGGGGGGGGNGRHGGGGDGRGGNGGGGGNQPGHNPPDPDHPGPPDHDDGDKEIRRNEQEMVHEKEIWKLLKKLHNSEHLGHLIDHCRNGGAIGQVGVVLGDINQRTHVLERLERKEMQNEGANERRERLRHLGLDRYKITDSVGVSLLQLIAQERNLFNHYERTLHEISDSINLGVHLAGDQNSTDDQVIVHWNRARNRTLLAMRLVELLIRINAAELARIGTFRETGR